MTMQRYGKPLENEKTQNYTFKAKNNPFFLPFKIV